MRVGVLHGASVIVVHHVFRPDATLQIPEVGAELPAHATALGKAMLAWAEPEVVDDLLADEPDASPANTLEPAALRTSSGRSASGGRRPRA